MIVTALGGTPRFHHAALIPQAQELLAAESSERGKQVVLIIDEAHLLDAESLEGVRCLSNMGMDQTAPFCLLLLGQPTLRHRLRRGAFTALDQRIAVRYAIAGLDAKETTRTGGRPAQRTARSAQQQDPADLTPRLPIPLRRRRHRDDLPLLRRHHDPAPPPLSHPQTVRGAEMAGHIRTVGPKLRTPELRCPAFRW